MRAAVVFNLVSAGAGAVSLAVVGAGAVAGAISGAEWEPAVGFVVTMGVVAFQVLALLAGTLLAAAGTPPTERRRLARTMPFGYGLSLVRTAFVGLGLSGAAVVLFVAAAMHVLEWAALFAAVSAAAAVRRASSRRRGEA